MCFCYIPFPRLPDLYKLPRVQLQHAFGAEEQETHVDFEMQKDPTGTEIKGPAVPPELCVAQVSHERS